MPRMLFDRAQVGEVQQRGCGGENAVIDFAPLLINESDGFDELGRAFKVLLKKHWRLDSARPSLKDCGTVLQVRQDEVADTQVVTEQLKLGDFLIGPVDSFEAGYGHMSAVDRHPQITLRILERQEFFSANRRTLLRPRSLHR